MFVSEVPIHVDVPDRFMPPGEPAGWVKFVPPMRKVLREARKGARREAMESQRELVAGLDGDAVRAIFESAQDQYRKHAKESQEEIDEYDVDLYDVDALLEACVTEWSFDQPIGPKAFERLDQAAAEWLAQKILDSVRPPTKEEQGKP